jgi:hypothetical protein
MSPSETYEYEVEWPAKPATQGNLIVGVLHQRPERELTFGRPLPWPASVLDARHEFAKQLPCALDSIDQLHQQAAYDIEVTSDLESAPLDDNEGYLGLATPSGRASEPLTFGQPLCYPTGALNQPDMMMVRRGTL